ncbi:MAG TPA: DUF5313 family protein [Jatrophihabitans sp.]|nr:DUF5313 family protein [Jatrophihabitans sp.]
MSDRSVEAWEIAAESMGLATGPRLRPNPLLWMWYAYWGPLSERYAVWVLYDATCATWIIRHVARILAAAALPVAAIAIFLPAPAEVRVLTALLAGGCAVLFTATWINESTEHRLMQAGYDWRVGSALRTKRAEVDRLLRHW